MSHIGIISGTTGRPLDVIELADQRVYCVVGIYPSEEVRPQPLDVSVAMHLDTEGAANDAGLALSVDYARVAGELRFLLEACRFGTLEAAAHALARYLLAPPTADAPRAQLVAVDVRLSKPHALGGDGAGVPSLSIRRYADQQRYVIETKPFGHVDVIHESAGCGVYRLRIAPGRSIPTHVHRRMDESELVLGSGLLLQGRRVKAGTAHRWPHGHAHRYDNPSALEQTILCVDRPRFSEDDEVPAPAPEAGFTMPEGRSHYPREATIEDPS